MKRWQNILYDVTPTTEDSLCWPKNIHKGLDQRWLAAPYMDLLSKMIISSCWLCVGKLSPFCHRTGSMFTHPEWTSDTFVCSHHIEDPEKHIKNSFWARDQIEWWRQCSTLLKVAEPNTGSCKLPLHISIILNDNNVSHWLAGDEELFSNPRLKFNTTAIPYMPTVSCYGVLYWLQVCVWATNTVGCDKLFDFSSSCGIWYM